MKKDFLTLDDIKREELLEMLDSTAELKKKPINNHLKNKVLCLIFEKPSTRTKVSFETGIIHMGGQYVFLDKNTIQLSRGESVEDTAKVLERYNDAIIARVFSHKSLEIMSKKTDIPIINALSDLSHPCQILADLFTIKEKFKSFRGLKLAYIGDGNNVCNSLLLGCAKVGIDISVGSPKGYEPNKEMTQLAKNYTKISKSKVSITEDPVSAVKNANIVYNDTFISMGDEKEKDKRMKAFIPKYQVTENLLEKAASDVLYMHCLPAHRGKEVTSEVIDGPRSIIFDQAENRMHVQKALMSKMMGDLIWM